MTDAPRTTTYTYSNRDQALTKATPEGTLTYTYDLSGNVASVVSSNAGGGNVAYAWDQDNRLQSVTDNGNGGVTNYSYDATNQVASFGYPNSVAHSYSYDARDRVTGLSVTNGSSVIASYTQTFSPSGRKQSAAEANGRTPNYSYDPIYRLTNETISGDPTSTNNGSLTYSLDPVGNRLSLTSTLAALQPQSLSYDADDRLASDSYDANGNTLTSGGTGYTDFEDRLVSTSTGVQMVYDGDGNRISETSGSVTTKYLVDTQTPTGYAQVAEELVNGAVSAQFTYGPMRISQTRAGTLSYYGYDAGGSTRELISASGAVTDTYAYDAFGNTVARTGSTVNEFQYRGEQFDPALGMYYLRARYYLTLSGRFLNGDAVETSFAESQWNELPVHPYVYGDADPVNRIDPSGNDDDVEVAVAERTTSKGLEAFLKALTTAGLAYCAAQQPGCRTVNSGKIHAQGKTFGKNAGKGARESWQQEIPPPGFQGLAMLGALWIRLDAKNQRDLGTAFQKAAKYITADCPAARGCYPPGRGFANDSSKAPRDLEKDANRVDVDIFFGAAFMIP